jgi:hypothetical protein
MDAAPATPTTTVSMTPAAPVVTSSDRMVPLVLQKGLQEILLKTTIGLIAGTLTGIVLHRPTSAWRKGWAGVGAGMGVGSAWTRTNMLLEDLLLQQPPAGKK